MSTHTMFNMVCIYNLSDHWPHCLTVVQWFLGTTWPKHGRLFMHAPALRLAHLSLCQSMDSVTIWDSTIGGHHHHMPVHLSTYRHSVFRDPILWWRYRRTPFNFIRKRNLDETFRSLRTFSSASGRLTGEMTHWVEATGMNSWELTIIFWR